MNTFRRLLTDFPIMAKRGANIIRVTADRAAPIVFLVSEEPGCQTVSRSMGFGQRNFFLFLLCGDHLIFLFGHLYLKSAGGF